MVKDKLPDLLTKKKVPNSPDKKRLSYSTGKKKLFKALEKKRLSSSPNTKKLQYSPSKSETFLLLLLAIVAISALSINFLYLPEWTELTAKSSEYKAQKTLVENLRSEYDKLEEYTAQEVSLSSQLDELHAMIPTYLSEEEVLSAIDANAAKSGLEILGISISELSIRTQKDFLAQMILGASAPKNELNPDVAAYEETTGHDVTPEDTANTPTDETKKQGPFVNSKLVTMNYKGSYDSFVSFLAIFESQKRQVYFRSNNTSRAEDGSLTGSLTMLIFSSSNQLSLLDPNYPGYEYQTPDIFGKANPFAAFPNYAGLPVTARSAMSNPDFYAILNTYDDNSSKLVMGKYPVSSAQVFCDKNENVPARLTLSAEGNLCTYSYQLGDRIYADSFALNSKQSALSISILSRNRKSSMDNVAMTLAVENNTKLPLTIVVKYDDATNPRFHLGKTSGNVQVVNYN